MSIYLDVFLVSDRHVTGEISVYGARRDGDFPGGNIGDGHRKRTRVASGEDDDNALLNSVESGDSKWIVEIFIGGSTEEADMTSTPSATAASKAARISASKHCESNNEGQQTL